MTIDELLTKFQGKCWHEWEWNIPEEGIPPYVCLLCGYRAKDASRLDYADDHTAMELLRWFQREKKNMYDWFCAWMLRENPKAPVGTNNLLIYINQQIEADSKSYMRWVVLLAGWLRLEETRNDWGWEEVCSTFQRETNPCGSCTKCNGSGKIRSKWAREGKDEACSWRQNKVQE